MKQGRVMMISLGIMQTKLNELGMSDWELVSVSMGNMTEPRLIFNR